MPEYLTKFYATDYTTENLKVDWGNNVYTNVTVFLKNGRLAIRSNKALTKNLLQQLFGKLSSENVKINSKYYNYTTLATYRSEPVLNAPVTVHYEVVGDVIDAAWRSGAIAANSTSVRKIPFKQRHVYSTLHLAVQANGTAQLFNKSTHDTDFIEYWFESGWRTVKPNVFHSRTGTLNWYLLSIAPKTVTFKTNGTTTPVSSIINTKELSQNEIDFIHQQFNDYGFYDVYQLDTGFIASDNCFCLLLGMANLPSVEARFAHLL